MTLLHYASDGGHHDTVRVLLEHHSDVKTRDDVGTCTNMYISLVVSATHMILNQSDRCLYIDHMTAL